VEGPDDVYVFFALLSEYKIPIAEKFKPVPDKISINDGKGVDNLKKRVRMLLKPKDEDIPLEKLGIVIDADSDINARWQSIRDILRDADYTNVPQLPLDRGTIIKQDYRPTVGVWIMPDNKVSGAIEDFIKFLVPPDDNLWNRAEEAVADIPEEYRRFVSFSKANIHTWLAWQKEPGVPMGTAITYKFLDAQSIYAQELVSWINRLFFD
jgi:hypothetical protein